MLVTRPMYICAASAAEEERLMLLLEEEEEGDGWMAFGSPGIQLLCQLIGHRPSEGTITTPLLPTSSTYCTLTYHFSFINNKKRNGTSSQIHHPPRLSPSLPTSPPRRQILQTRTLHCPRSHPRRLSQLQPTPTTTTLPTRRNLSHVGISR